ncbi:hypothetical protein [Chamaesiphon sp. VAR_69_metabat_338]|uniref:hypothetical protein n=1 Tax=Chamaesiphon sp. VAR_69_metabat_338 TaxID=2964704 RepID=UPI00286E267F|nr:hypothetical protein [Chamaesiphon sp. VAR_69_metabat_338]
MKPVVKSDKKIPPKKSSNAWLSVSVICLLASGTFGAKVLLLVDNDLELKTKFAGQSWQLDKNSLKKYADDFDRFVTESSIEPIGASLQQESINIVNSTNAALSEPRTLCLPTSDLAAMFNQSPDSTATKTNTSATNKNLSSRNTKDLCINTGDRK